GESIELKAHDDTHNRHQHAWTFLYLAGPQKPSKPGHGQCWTSWPCFASRGSGVRVPLAPPAKTIPTGSSRGAIDTSWQSFTAGSGSGACRDAGPGVAACRCGNV